MLSLDVWQWQVNLWFGFCFCFCLYLRKDNKSHLKKGCQKKKEIVIENGQHFLKKTICKRTKNDILNQDMYEIASCIWVTVEISILAPLIFLSIVWYSIYFFFAHFLPLVKNRFFFLSVIIFFFSISNRCPFYSKRKKKFCKENH